MKISSALCVPTPENVGVPDNVPDKTAPFIVLLVNICDPVNVATVPSIANVIVFPAPEVSIPVPPVNVKVSLSRSIDKIPPESP